MKKPGLISDLSNYKTPIISWLLSLGKQIKPFYRLGNDAFNRYLTLHFPQLNALDITGGGIFLNHFFYCCLNIVVSISLPLLSSVPLTPNSHPQSFPPLALSLAPLYMFFDDTFHSFPVISLPPPLWLLSVCSLFQCLWLYFACLFILLIKSPPGLLHLASCSPVPSMLSQSGEGIITWAFIWGEL